MSAAQRLIDALRDGRSKTAEEKLRLRHYAEHAEAELAQQARGAKPPDRRTVERVQAAISVARTGRAR
jgi:hypothetical protein